MSPLTIIVISLPPFAATHNRCFFINISTKDVSLSITTVDKILPSHIDNYYLISTKNTPLLNYQPWNHHIHCHLTILFWYYHHCHCKHTPLLFPLVNMTLPLQFLFCLVLSFKLYKLKGIHIFQSWKQHFHFLV